MIVPTDEMEQAFEDAAEPCCNCGDTHAGLAAVLAIVERDQAGELAELRTLFELQWRRMTEATAMWRAEDPENRANVLPDLGDLLTWLMGRVKELQLASAALDLPRCSGSVVTFAPAPCGRDHNHPAHDLGLPPDRDTP